MAEAKEYWKLFQQQNILDGLRVFIDLSEEFLNQMSTEGIISKETMDRLKSSQWPANRTELIQTLVRKRWTQDTFNKFYNIMLRTQDPRLCKLFTDRLSSASNISDQSLSSVRKQSAHLMELYSEMDELLRPLDMQAKVKVQTMLRDRDLEIAKLRTDNEETRKELQDVTVQLNNETIQHHRLGTGLADWLAGLAIDISATHREQLDESGVLVESLKAVDRYIGTQNRRIEQLESEQTELKSSANALGEEIEKLRDDRDRLLLKMAPQENAVDEVQQDETKTKEELQKTLPNGDAKIRIASSEEKLQQTTEAVITAVMEPKETKKKSTRKTSLPFCSKSQTDKLKDENSCHSERVRRMSLPKLHAGSHHSHSCTSRSPRSRSPGYVGGSKARKQ